MPGLIRGVARTAVVAGTATAVSNRVSRRQANRWADQQQAAAPPEYAEQAPSGGTGTDERLARLRELGELHEAGVLTDAEFEAQKAQILSS
jgi:Short C-terminal domain